ncbi:MAG: hypothetical protein AB1505_17920 [Candidatus Latescibacterota bacterium]
MGSESTLTAQPNSTWLQIERHLTRIWETQLPRLTEEASWFGLDDGALPEIWSTLDRMTPQSKLDLFSLRNPELGLDRITDLDSYDGAVGVLRMFTGG